MKTFDITAYGAMPGTLCTGSVQKAFDDAAVQHGVVVIPAGEFICGTLDMRGASLYLEKGAVLKGSGDIDDYRSTGYMHNEMGDVHALLFCTHAEGVTISGDGVIDLNGSAFYDFSHPLVYEGITKPLTAEELAECTVKYERRPQQPMFFYDCRHITVRDVRIKNAPSWTMAFIECTDIRVLDLTIDNSLNIPNCDGMHFCSCTNILVRGCNISAGDDCIAFTCVTDWNKPCERAVVSDCIFRSCSKAISVGYMHSVVRDITFNNIIVYESNRACVIMASTGTGLVENVIFSNLRLDTRVRVGNWWGNGEPICVMGTPHNNENYRNAPPIKRFDVSIRNILFQNIICTGENVIAVVGEKGSVENVRIDQLIFERKDSKNLHIKGHMIDLAPGEQNAFMPESERAWLYLRGLRECKLTRCDVRPWHGKSLETYITDCENTYVDMHV